jgi:hypothetical protein
MSAADAIWGIAVIGAGVFISVYGNVLFRFTLAAMGFGLGFLLGMRVFEGQDETARVLIALAAGGIAAVGLFSLVKFTFYIAGGILGLVIGVVAIGIIDIFSSRPGGVFQTGLALAGVLLGAIFASRLGNIAVLLGSAGAGALLLVNGLHVLFESQFNAETTDPAANLDSKLSLTIFTMLFVIAMLGQWNTQRIRQRQLT